MERVQCSVSSGIKVQRGQNPGGVTALARAAARHEERRDAIFYGGSLKSLEPAQMSFALASHYEAFFEGTDSQDATGTFPPVTRSMVAALAHEGIAPFSHRFTVGCDTPTASANARCVI
nr:hypothetical protein [Salipiger sp. PrR007]